MKTNHIYIVPMLNVDGYKYISDNWSDIKDVDSTDTTRRKNLNNSECSNGTYGVDLGKNFSYQWGFNISGSSGEPCHPSYRGTEAFSEPETRGLRDLALSLNVSLYMSYGSGDSHYVIPNSYDNDLDYDGPRGWFYHDIK